MSRSAYASTTIVKVKDGTVGEHGVNSVIVHLYKRSMDVPSIPSNTLTYNFETGILSGDLENWSQNYDELKKLYESELNSIIDSDNNEVTLEENNHIYMITAMATSIEDTYDINFSKWTSPLVISQSNFNQTVIYLYQRTNQLPSLPGSIKYNFATGQITGELGNWSTSINSSDNGAPCYVTSACAVGHGVSCEVSNWSGITILVEDGKSPTVTKEGNVTTITDASGQTVIIEDGSVITRILPIYYFAPLNASAPAQPNVDTVIYNTDEPRKWTTLIPTYTTSGTYYTCTMTEFKTGDSPIFSDVTVDYAKTSQSLEIAGLEAKAKYFIHNSDGSYVIQGLENFNENNINTYGFNALMAPGGIKLSYNALNLLTLGNQSLAIKTPPQDSTTEGKTAMLLTGNSLTFYEPGTTTEASILDGSGLTLKKGGIISGTPEQNAYIYISTEDYGTALTIANQTSSLWRMIIGQNFGVTKNGGVYASNGKIGGWNLTSNKLYYNTDTPGLYGDTVVLSAEPYGTASNEVIANHVANGTSNRWRFSIGDNFGITADGTLYATNAKIDGHLRTTSGTIGNWEIESSDGTYGGALYTREFGEDGGIYITPGFKTSLSSHLKGSVYERAVPAPTFETWDNGRIYYIYSNGKYISQYGIPFDETKIYYTTSEITDSDYNVIDLTSFELHSKDWFLIAGRKFGITTDGILYAQDAQIKGDIYATSLTLARGALKVTDIEGMPDVNFLVQKDGIILSNDGKTSFSVSSEGKLAANSAEIKGTIYARAGEIGGWNIGTDENRSLFYGSEIPGATTNNLVLSKSSEKNNVAIAESATGLNWFISAGRNFGVTTDGAIYANAGQIGGCTFTNGVLKITDANISGKISASHINVSDITLNTIASDSRNYATISSGGLNIYQSGVSIASFGSSTRVGNTSSTYITIVPTGSTAGISFKTNGRSSGGNLLSGLTIAEFGFNNNTGYTTEGWPESAWYTLGYRLGTKGYYSIVAGYGCYSTHNASFAGGIDCAAYGPMSFAYGNHCVTGYAGNSSTNPGIEGNNGWASVALGSSLIAQKDAQVVVGAYNNTYDGSFIVGIGGPTNGRCNGLAVDWNGDLRIRGQVYVGCEKDSSGGTKLGSGGGGGSYTLPAATSTALGGIKIGYSNSGTNYGVVLSSQKAYVSIPNNITGSGSNGYLAKFNGTNSLTSGPAIGSNDGTFLRHDGSWATIATTGRVQIQTITITGISIAAKGYDSSDRTYNLPAITGMKPIAIAGYFFRSTGSSWLNMFSCYIDGTTLYYRFRNLHTDTAANANCTFKILYAAQ